MTLVERLLTVASARLVSIKDNVPLIEAARLLRAGTDIIVVCDPDGVMAGVITKTDVVGQISHCLGASCRTPASIVMTRGVIACRPGDWLKDVWSIMKEHQLKNIPVTGPDARPLGVLNARDALQALLQEVEDEDVLLRDYVMGIGYH
jgi:CBS domain-containing protein